MTMVVIVAVGLVLLAVAAAVTVRDEQVEAEEAAIVEARAMRYETFAEAAERLRTETGREPSVREIYAAAYGEVEDDEPLVVDLRDRMERLMDAEAAG